ncbi:hypothetical protein [Burkholderia sp. BCC0405]|uniref:hypothetical protein n=1 Tax=Burkholderia sp. BCC0405 TaxID=2676298 RepID=UPI00158DE156|nr:hypothetical protein [Burkholderia sp. BCC0405]
MNESCKHGIPWKCYCAQCEFALALQTEVRYGKEVDEARKVIEREQGKDWEAAKTA